MSPTYLEMKLKLQTTFDELERNKETNKDLQFQIMKQELWNHLAEQENRSLKDQNQEL